MKLASSTYYYRARQQGAVRNALEERITQICAEFPRYGSYRALAGAHPCADHHLLARPRSWVYVGKSGSAVQALAPVHQRPKGLRWLRCYATPLGSLPAAQVDPRRVQRVAPPARRPRRQARLAPPSRARIAPLTIPQAVVDGGVAMVTIRERRIEAGPLLAARPTRTPGFSDRCALCRRKL